MSQRHHFEFRSEHVAAGCPGYTAPLSVDFSPSGKLLTYLYPDETGSRQRKCECSCRYRIRGCFLRQ
jgi:hypothetical protein